MEKDGPSVKKHFSDYLAIVESDSTDIAMRVKNSYDITIAHNDIGDAFVFDGDMAQAIAHYEKALSYDPYNTNAMNKLAYVYMRLGEPDKTRTYLQRVFELDPSNEEARIILRSIRPSKTD